MHQSARLSFVRTAQPAWVTKRWDHHHKYNHITHPFEIAAANGDHKTMHAMIDEQPHGPFDRYLYWAALHRRPSIVNRILRKDISTDIESGLIGACESGDPGLVSYLLGRGATNWNDGLLASCSAGHFGIARLMIDLGATNLDDGLASACKAGYGEIIQLLLLRGAKCQCNKNLAK
jgi:hypothetical protein